MKKYFILLALFLAAGFSQAKNEVTKIDQVVESVDVTADVDYTITGDTPFGEMGSVNIVNMDHAVVIIKKMKPSKVISSLMSHIYINGEKAVNGQNCQVKMYDRGAIIMPYGKDFKPLTCYTEKNYGGTSCNTYAEGNTGGYMNTLTDDNLLNNIRSFKLKRGYMVTFATGTSGWGYSRCFIADNEDLEIPEMPNVLLGKASSFRLFKWWNVHKAGGASSGDYTFNQAINAGWCYDWGTGNASLLPDIEWIPNHIYEDYPSSSACGSVTGACNMKTNNEPGNSSDDHPQDVETVLNNWQNLMRTGLRLCSESSHDGSWSHLRAFIDSIDARGWRCDMLDLHCYWGAGSFNDFSGYYNSYGGRPIWISEWMWGASWNASNWSSGGIFAQAPDGKDSDSDANQTCMYNNTKPIIDKLNASPYVERYAFWNGEAVASKIYYNGKLTKFGEYYANVMDEGQGYNASLQKIPNVVVTAPGELKAVLNETDGLKTVRLSWTDPNGDMLDSMVIQHKDPGAYRWSTIKRVALKDVTSKSGASYGVTDTLQYDAEGIYSKLGLHSYRVATYSADRFKGTSSTVAYTNDVSVTLAGASSVGDLQYGRIEYNDYSKKKANITKCVDPVVVVSVPSGLGAMSTNYGAGGQMAAAPGTSAMGGTGFQWQAVSWYGDAAKTLKETAGKEHTDFIVLPHDNYRIGNDFFIEVGDSVSIKDVPVQVTFNKPWPEGETPVVICELLSTAIYGSAINVYDVTNTGFKVALHRQSYQTRFSTQMLNYIAVSQGVRDLGTGMSIKAGICTNAAGDEITTRLSRKGGTLGMYFGGSDCTFTDPYILVGAQTDNFTVCSEMARPAIFSDNSITVTRSFDLTASTQPTVADIKDESLSNKMGYIVISSDGDAEAYPDPTLARNTIKGDVNGDGVVDIADVNAVLTVIFETEGYVAAADVNGDGVVDIADVNAVLTIMFEA